LCSTEYGARSLKASLFHSGVLTFSALRQMIEIHLIQPVVAGACHRQCPPKRQLALNSDRQKLQCLERTQSASGFAAQFQAADLLCDPCGSGLVSPLAPDPTHSATSISRAVSSASTSASMPTANSASGSPVTLVANRPEEVYRVRRSGDMIFQIRC